uniref:DNA repair protein RAD51 homolog 3 n=1 Tax=Phallusia mammillata TaxID=59560 RepID=A0A6F9DR08_9ASCI|nr:DNA repair protein RAD51 homolog 3-like [Phallusia mammillata]
MFQTAASILQKELSTKQQSSIVTFCRSLDEALGGGISIGSVTEIAGESGCGKTQLAFQLSVNVQIPSALGGAEGEAIFIDTENTFSTNRLVDISESVVQHCTNLCQNGGSNFTIDMCMSKIYLFKCLTIVELIATVHQLHSFIQTHPNVRLLVVDSIANCVRAEEDMKTRNKVLNDLAQKFRSLAINDNLAVVLINQVTTSFSAIGSSGVMIPALGATWSHVAATKIMLIKQENERFALLYKSPSKSRDAVKYMIVKEGFRDIPSKQKQPKQSSSPKASLDMSLKTRAITKQEINEEFIELSQRLLDIFCQDDSKCFDYTESPCTDSNLKEFKANQLKTNTQNAKVSPEMQVQGYINSMTMADKSSAESVMKFPLTQCVSFDDDSTSIKIKQICKKRKPNDSEESNLDDDLPKPPFSLANEHTDTGPCDDVQCSKVVDAPPDKPPLSPVLKLGNHRKRRRKTLHRS